LGFSGNSPGDDGSAESRYYYNSSTM